MAAGIAQLIDSFESFLSADDRKTYAQVLGIFKGKAAQTRSDEELVMDARLFLDWTERHTPFYVAPEQRIEMSLQFLAFFKDLAEKGDLYSMRYVAFAYANGVEHQTVTRHDNGWGISVRPDHENALLWCRRAAEAGDEIAARALPGIERDAAKDAPPPSPPKGPFGSPAP